MLDENSIDKTSYVAMNSVRKNCRKRLRDLRYDDQEAPSNKDGCLESHWIS